ncbi:hypothetical protein F2P81_020897 [Scophthalmus maximus]|uniref:BED-type domain-containing protein n=1 Tax=Scophthalmus maximus TaxID=52904 RepID=A0A6A4S3C6_SCOMX|nr:hypothetical protein F2P81_020897 [Scophthalmus maximus]
METDTNERKAAEDYYKYWLDHLEMDSKFQMCRESCKQVATKSSSMTNLYHHLQQRHKPQYEECVKRCACNPELEAFAAFCTETNATTGLEYGTRVNLVVWGDSSTQII